MAQETSREILVEAMSGDRFEAEIPCGTKLNNIAADFFESQGWPTQDRRGRGQRAVVELINPQNPDETKRLNGEFEVCEALQDGDTLRIFPESIAGAVDHEARLRALITDHSEMKQLEAMNDRIEFEPNRSYAPYFYEITFHYKSFVELTPGEHRPRVGEIHRAEVTLGADYPRKTPLVLWRSKIFHPNIRPADGAVCLGVLLERYLPGMGLARLVQILAEMLQWRNFDPFHAFNTEAAQWAAEPEHWEQIRTLGGHPFQGPIGEWMKKLEPARPRISFRRVQPTV